MSTTTKQRTREELYNLFGQGAIPSGADFADFIKSQLNLKDDGIGISESSDDPVCFTAHGDGENFLDFADSGGDKKWRLSGYDEAITKEGFNITADDQSKLFVERETGNVGIGTDGPEAKLHIIQTSATGALRIDDEGNDTTPLVVTSEGKMGIGTGSPVARLHISNSGSDDIVRVDDTDGDATPFIIDNTGNVALGYRQPLAKLAVDGGVSIGENKSDLGNGDLYVAGNMTVNGSVVLSGNEGIQINAPLRSGDGDQEITIDDNLVIADPKGDGSKGNLTVKRDVTLGTYNKVYNSQNVLTVNGRIETGGDATSGEQQYGLEINKVLTVDRTPNAQQVTVDGNLTATGSVALGDTQTDTIYLNGKVSSNLGDVTVNDNLTVTGNTTLGDAQTDNVYLNGKVSSNLGDVIIDDNLTVTGNTNLGDALSDNIYLNGTVNANSGTVNVGNHLNINGSLSFDNANTKVGGIVAAIDNLDDTVITTEGAVKRYVDGLMTNVISQINATNAKIHTFKLDIRRQRVPGATNAGGWGGGWQSYYDFYPPAGFTMNQLVYVAASPANIPFSGDVNGDDTLACYADVYSDRIRCYCGNSEQRDYSTVAMYALWEVN